MDNELKMINDAMFLEFLGVKMNNENSKTDINGAMMILFTVPQYPKITYDDVKKEWKNIDAYLFNTDIETNDFKTSDGLTKIAKNILVRSIMSDASEISKNKFNEELSKDFDISKFARFFRSVRRNEVWKLDDGREVIQKFIDKINEMNSYEEV